MSIEKNHFEIYANYYFLYAKMAPISWQHALQQGAAYKGENATSINE